MVKNLQGGSKTKSHARKSSSSSTSYASARTPLRLCVDEFEKYACVIKIFGQGRLLVRTVDDCELQCVIRNKFKGRSKRDNIITIGCIILVGLREYEGVGNYKTCDVLEVYDKEDQNQLKNIPSTRVNRLEMYYSSIECTGKQTTTSGDFIFSDEVDVVVQPIISSTSSRLPIIEEISEAREEEIDIDDI